MSWFDKLERRFGKFAIDRLMYYIVIMNGLAFVAIFLDRSGFVYNNLVFDPGMIIQGEVWRLISYIFIPPSLSLLWVIFALYFYYMIGTALEGEWGTFKFNLYYLTGVIATSLAGFLSWSTATSFYLNLSLFLAFAQIYPNFEVLLFFILPVKIKYLAWLNWAFIGYTVIFGNFSDKVSAIVSIANFFLFFGGDFFKYAQNRRQVKFNRKRFFDEINSTPPIHRCAVCGRTERDDKRLYFSYCKECFNEYEYCSDHLNNHEHVKMKN